MIDLLPDLYEAFIDAYRRQRPFYARLADYVATSVESSLVAGGVRALVTNRAKSIDRVRGKLEKLATDGFILPDIDDVRRAIYDLSGIRVALYFPGDMESVKSLVEELFLAQHPKHFPTKRTNSYNHFPGYCATHYIGSLRASDLDQIGTEYSQELFEIQIASVFMHAWAEVEHDLRYKPLTGDLSEDELSILESLNGVALTAETQLRQFRARRPCPLDVIPAPGVQWLQINLIRRPSAKAKAANPRAARKGGSSCLIGCFMKLCYLDESGDLGAMPANPSPTGNDQPIFSKQRCSLIMPVSSR
ncbi:MAG: RelA/SpoT domain-containing protein [Candidatus Eremiobacteraeota bacterium]|nr:RelA/SpoT domain-containing protein [Candidatus Eremiobacteraeota bacterium]